MLNLRDQNRNINKNIQKDLRSSDINYYFKRSYLNKNPFKNIVMLDFSQLNIKHILPMYNNTLVFMYCNKFVVRDSSGNVLYVKQFQHIEEFIVISDKEIILTELQIVHDYKKKRSFVYWNICTNFTCTQSYQSMYQNNIIKLYYFPYTHLIGVIQQQYIRQNKSPNKRPIQENQLQTLSFSKISYYQFNSKSNQLKLVCQILIDFSKVSNLHCQSTKMDNYSKICFYTSKSNVKEEIHITEVVVQNSKGAMRNVGTDQDTIRKLNIKQYTIKLNKIISYPDKFFHFWLTDVCHIDDDKIYLKVQKKADVHKYFSQTLRYTSQEDLCDFQRSYSIVYNINSKTGYKLLSDERHHQVQFTQNMRYIKRTRNQFFNTFQYRCQKKFPQLQSAQMAIQMPVYYIDNDTLKVARIQQTPIQENGNGSSADFYSYLDFNPNLQVQFKVTSMFQLKISYRKTESNLPFDLAQATTFYVKQLIENTQIKQNQVCDDLLDEVCKLIVDNNNNQEENNFHENQQTHQFTY